MLMSRHTCKVFDAVKIEIIVEKLKMCGIRGTASLFYAKSVNIHELVLTFQGFVSILFD